MRKINIKIYAFALLFCLIGNSCDGQYSKRYKKEYCKFLKFIRNDIFENLGYKEMSHRNDSIYILEYTSNKGLFKSIPFYGNTATNGLISEAEKLDVIKKIYKDSSKNKIEIDCIDKCYLLPEIIAKKMDAIIYKFSNPVFAKNYKICYFSLGFYNEESYSQSSYLYQKKHGIWKAIKRFTVSDY